MTISDICKEWGISRQKMVFLIENKAFLDNEVQLKDGQYYIQRTDILRKLGTIQSYKSKYRSKLAFSAIRSGKEIILYAPKYITSETKKLGLKVAGDLLKNGDLSDVEEEVLMAFYIFNKDSLFPSDIKEEISMGKGFAGPRVSGQGIDCQTARVCVHNIGCSFNMWEYEQLTDMVMKDWISGNTDIEFTPLLENQKSLISKKEVDLDIIVKNIKQLFKEEHEQAIEQGKKEKTLEVAKKMLFKGMSLEEVVDITGLTKEVIQGLE